MNFDYTKAGTTSQELILRKLLASRGRLAKSELAGSLRAWKVWSACVAHTADWQKSSDRTFIKIIAGEAKVKRDHVGPILREFDRLDIFRWSQEDTHNHSMGLLSLPSVEDRPAKPLPESRSCPWCGEPVKLGNHWERPGQKTWVHRADRGGRHRVNDCPWWAAKGSAPWEEHGE